MRLKYTVDIVFCIDGTASMSTLKDIKGQAVHLYQDTRYYFEKMAKPVEQIRARIILFRDFLSDGNHALMETDFFHLPEETSDFDRILNNIEVFGGGDDEEDGLEALGLAIQSKWNRQGMRKRHIIVLWTDAAPHELGFGSKGVNYPKKMAGSFDELTKWWMDEDMISQTGKRLLLFTPNKSWWNKISHEWNNVLCSETEEHAVISETDYNDIISLIAYSL